MISFQLDWAQGNVPAVFTHSARLNSLIHMCRAERLPSGPVSVMTVHEPSCFFIFPLFPLLCPFENCKSARKKNVFFQRGGCLSGYNCSLNKLDYETVCYITFRGRFMKTTVRRRSCADQKTQNNDSLKTILQIHPGSEKQTLSSNNKSVVNLFFAPTQCIFNYSNQVHKRTKRPDSCERNTNRYWIWKGKVSRGGVFWNKHWIIKALSFLMEIESRADSVVPAYEIH